MLKTWSIATTDIEPKDPHIVQELSRDQRPGKTAAGEFLGLSAPSEASSSSTSASSAGQPEATSPPPSTSEPEAREIPKPSASSFRESPNQFQSQASPLSDFLSSVGSLCRPLYNDVFVPMMKQAAAERIRGAMPGGAMPGGAVGKFLATLMASPGSNTSIDELSSRDHFLARGLPGDLDSRTQWAQARGINLEPGSQAFGEAVRKAIMREWPL